MADERVDILIVGSQWSTNAWIIGETNAGKAWVARNYDRSPSHVLRTEIDGVEALALREGLVVKVY